METESEKNGPDWLGRTVRNTKWDVPFLSLEDQIMRRIQSDDLRNVQIRRDRKSALFFFSLAILLGAIMNFFPDLLLYRLSHISRDTLVIVFQFSVVLFLFTFIDYHFCSARFRKSPAGGE